MFVNFTIITAFGIFDRYKPYLLVDDMEKFDAPVMDLFIVIGLAEAEFQFFSDNLTSKFLLFLDFLLGLRNKLLIHKYPKLVD